MKPIFHLHIFRDGRGLMANAGFTQKGGKLPIIKSGEPNSDLAGRAVDAAIAACNPARRIDMKLAAEAVQQRLGDGYKVVHIAGDLRYPPRITVLERSAA
jgi:hypothetical protein